MMLKKKNLSGVIICQIVTSYALTLAGQESSKWAAKRHQDWPRKDTLHSSGHRRLSRGCEREFSKHLPLLLLETWSREEGAQVHLIPGAAATPELVLLGSVKPL